MEGKLCSVIYTSCIGCVIAPVAAAKSLLLNLTSIYMPLLTLGSKMMNVLLCQTLLVAHLMAEKEYETEATILIKQRVLWDMARQILGCTIQLGNSLLGSNFRTNLQFV